MRLNFDPDCSNRVRGSEIGRGSLLASRGFSRDLRLGPDVSRGVNDFIQRLGLIFDHARRGFIAAWRRVCECGFARRLISQDLQQQLHYLRIEFDAGQIGDDLFGFASVESPPVRTVGDEREVSVNGAQDPRARGDRLARQTVGVPSAVPPFVMPADEQLGLAGKFEFTRGLFAKYRVAPQIQGLIPTERARSQQVVALHGAFAQVVSQGCELERGQVYAVQPHSRPDLLGRPCDCDRMRFAVTFDAIDLDGDLEQAAAERFFRIVESQYRLLCLHQYMSSENSHAVTK